MVWHKVAESRAELFGAGVDMAEVEVDGKTVLVVKVGGEMYACASKCPHAGARMKDGYLDAQGNLVCPLHRYRFDPKTGRNVSGEGYFLKRYMVKDTEDGVFVGMEEKKGIFG
ncbi:MAG: hypothetical protein RIR96_873 [Bacteroidota bacterium]|jgi:nitrite reductase/ring-hydroxylating ferredoxin subunit